MRLLNRWPQEVALHLQSFAVAVLLVMIAFYGIAAFHLQVVLVWLRSIARSEGVIYYLAVTSVIFLIGITTKVGALWLLGPKPTPWRVLKRTFLAVSFYLILIGSLATACVLLARRLGSLFETRYWAEAQWFWIGLLLFLVFGFFAMVLKGYGLYSASVLRELRAVPVVSPLFCFAGPKFFLDNVQKFGVRSEELRPHAILMVVAGVLFLVCLIGIALVTQSTSTPAKSEGRLVLPTGEPLQAAESPWLGENGLTLVCFAVLGIALYLFALALLDGVLRMALATGTAVG